MTRLINLVPSTRDALRLSPAALDIAHALERACRSVGTAAEPADLQRIAEAAVLWACVPAIREEVRQAGASALGAFDATADDVLSAAAAVLTGETDLSTD